MIRRVLAWTAPLALAFVPLLRWGEDFRFARIALLCAAAVLAWATRPLARRSAAALALLAAGPALAAVSWVYNGLSPLGAAAMVEMAAWLCAAWVIVLDERPADYALPWIAAVAAASVYGAGQALTLFEMPFDAYGKRDPASTFGLSNFAAETLAVTIPLTVAVFLRTKRLALRSLLPAALVTQVAYLLLAESRAGWLGLTAALAVALLAWRPANDRAWMGAVLAAVLFVGAFAVIGGSRLRVVGNDDPSIAFRKEAWAATLAMIGDAPLLGVGPGGFAANIPNYAGDRLQTLSVRVRRSINHPHNEFLGAAAERGLPGLAWLLALLGAAAFALWKRGAPWELGALAGGAATAVFGFPLQQAPFWAAAAIAVSLGLAPGERAANAAPASPRGGARRAAIAMLIAGLALFFAVRAIASDHARQAALLLETARRVSYRDPAEADALRARAAEHLSTSLALWPYDPETLFNRAAASATAADKIAAMRAYLAVVPADKLARVGLAQALADDGQLPAAEETLQMVLVEKNAPAEAYHRLIGLYLRDAKYEPALQTADEAMKKFPANMQIVIDMADVYRIKGDHARAVPLYQQALVTQRDEPGIYLRAGLSYMALGDYAKAEQVFASGSKLAPRNTQFLVYLARLELASNRRAEARRHLFSALQYDPELANNLREVAPELQPLLKEQTQP